MSAHPVWKFSSAVHIRKPSRMLQRWCVSDCSLGCPGDEEQEDEEESVMLDMDFIQQHRVWSHSNHMNKSVSCMYPVWSNTLHVATGTLCSGHVGCFSTLPSCMLRYAFSLCVTAHLCLVWNPTTLSLCCQTSLPCMSPVYSSAWKGGIETNDRKTCSHTQSLLPLMLPWLERWHVNKQ